VVTGSGELTSYCRDLWPRLVGALSLTTGDRHVAEEIAQEALVRVCEKWDDVQAMESPDGWAFRVAFNLANSHFRRRGAERRARRRLGAVVDVARPEVDAADALALRHEVAALPEPQRSVLVMRYFGDLSVAEVAGLLELPENTVKTHTRRAIDRLRERGLLDNTTIADSTKEADGAG
jgi:RNA polymerase sigma-70 factor, ECF subfamily